VKQDGTELSQWSVDLPRYAVNSMSLNPSGSLLLVLSDYEVNVYSTVNGDLVDTGVVTYENILRDEIFICAAFQDDTIDSVVTMTSPDRDCHGVILASDDHQCLLMMTHSHFRVFNKTTSRHRDIAIEKFPPKRYLPTHHW